MIMKVILNIAIRASLRDVANQFLESLGYGPCFSVPLCDNEKNIISHYAGSAAGSEQSWVDQNMLTLISQSGLTILTHIGDFTSALKEWGLVPYKFQIP